MNEDNREGVCVTGKVRYADDVQAAIALERVKEARAARPDRKPPERLFYFCRECDGWHLSSKPPPLAPEPPPKHDGETWAEYARRLEIRIKLQRDQLEAINQLRADAGNRTERKRIERLLRELGVMAERNAKMREANAALIARVREFGELAARRKESLDAILYGPPPRPFDPDLDDPKEPS